MSLKQLAIEYQNNIADLQKQLDKMKSRLLEETNSEKRFSLAHDINLVKEMIFEQQDIYHKLNDYYKNSGTALAAPLKFKQD